MKRQSLCHASRAAGEGGGVGGWGWVPPPRRAPRGGRGRGLPFLLRGRGIPKLLSRRERRDGVGERVDGVPGREMEEGRLQEAGDEAVLENGEEGVRLFGRGGVVLGGLERCYDGLGIRLVSALLDLTLCVCLVVGLKFRGWELWIRAWGSGCRV